MALKHRLLTKHPLLRFIRQLFVWLFLWYLRTWAKIALLLFRGTSIGIAGAVGKSTARNALAAILTLYKPTLVVSGNSETGIPLGLLGLTIGQYRLVDIIRVVLLAPIRIFTLKQYDFLIVEMGIDGPKPPKNMAYLLTIIKPDIGILLNESPAHVANYEQSVSHSTDDIIRYMTRDDGRLLTHAQTAIINGDDPFVVEFAQTLPKQTIRTVGTQKHHDISLSHHQVTDDGTTFEFSIHSFQIKDHLILTFPGMVLPEEAGIAIGAAILTGLAVGCQVSAISKNLTTNFSLPPGRGTIIQGINNATIFDSSYNASSASVRAFLTVIKYFTDKTRRPTFFVFGDMKELGSFSAYEHGQIAKIIPGSVNHVILVGTLVKDLVLPKIQDKKLTTLVHVDTSREAGEYLKKYLPEKAIVLFKGSQLLEEAIKFILQNNKDVSKLCRQDEFWKTAKKKNGTWIER